MALAMNTALSDYWYLLLAAAVGMFFGVRWWIRTSRGRYLWARTLLTLPLVGKVVQMSIMARFAAIFSILQRSGVSILDSLDILSETINNAALEREFSTIKEKLRSGQGGTAQHRTLFHAADHQHGRRRRRQSRDHA